MKYMEPIKNLNFEFTLVDRSKILNSPYQRELSTALVKKLVNSVDQGFIVPVILILREDGFFDLTDGQHRLATSDKVVGNLDYQVPAIIVPPEFRDFPLFYNIEKSDNIKDKCEKVYRLYCDKAEDGEILEKDIMAAANYEAYLFSLGFAYCENGLKSPSLVEPPVKKIDKGFLMGQEASGIMYQMPLEESILIRRERGVLIASLERTVEEVCQEYGISDFNLKRTIVSKSSQGLWGMRRKIEEPFEDALPMLMSQIIEMDWSWMRGQ